MRRFGQVIGIKPDRIEDYKKIHAECWPEVLATIQASNIRNYSIYLHGTTLFAYFEYIGDTFEKDMAKKAADPKKKKWWTHTSPMQEPFPDRKPGEWWTTMAEVFHTD